MKNLILGLLLIVTVLAATSCKKGGVFCYKGNGNTVSEIRSVSGFSEISLGLAAELVYTQSDNYSVSIETSDNLMKSIETKLHGSVLEIDFKKNKCFNSKEPIIITISSPNMDGFTISGSGSIVSENRLTSNSLKVIVSGSGNINLDSLNINKLKSVISGSGKLSASSIKDLSTQEISISGSGSVDFLDMPTLTSNVTVSGSGNCDVNVINSMSVDISGSGSVRYKGTPTVISNISGSGSIKSY